MIAFISSRDVYKRQAIGYAEADFDIDKVELHLRSTAGCIKVCENGAGVDFSEEEAAKILQEILLMEQKY